MPLTSNETFQSDQEIRAAALEAALRIGSLDPDGNSTSDGNIVVKNAELFFKFLTEDPNNEK